MSLPNRSRKPPFSMSESDKIYFTMLYGNYCYIFIENFPKIFSLCTLYTNENRRVSSSASPRGRRRCLIYSCQCYTCQKRRGFGWLAHRLVYTHRNANFGSFPRNAPAATQITRKVTYSKPGQQPEPPRSLRYIPERSK